jgi:7-cyano-7-deazaguanine reductase
MAYGEKRKLQCIIRAPRQSRQKRTSACRIRCTTSAVCTKENEEFVCPRIFVNSGRLPLKFDAPQRSNHGWCLRNLVLRSRYNSEMSKKSSRSTPRSSSPRYTAEHASAGLDHEFPEIETWPNQFPGYEIVVDDPEFTSVCPKTGLPDFGDLVIRYEPDRLCLELKSLKEYLQTYRNLGIFQENIVNQVLEDVVLWAKPIWAEVKGEFRPRGGISTVVIAKWPRVKKIGKNAGM